ncbi:unnamed protein product [Hermetia illucens]|uniref:Envelope protein n=1 Tax=Hermetia illucens TaxID=343691 RepID=A0A7R8V2M5_HERIL|nr:unnamed protein product [Hermetia illucens]
MEIVNIRQLALSINNLCIEELKQCKTLKLNSELHIRRLNYNLNSVYGLLGISPNIRLKRGLVNLVGSGLKFLFGTMDATDSEKIKAVLDTVGKDELNVKIGMEKNLLLIKEINKQSKMINMEQNTIKSRINEIINEIEKANNHANEHKKLIRLELYYEELFSTINHKIEPEQLLEQLNKLQEKDNLAIDPLISNHQQLMKDLKLKAFIKEKKIYVLISIDTVTKENFDLYEVLIFPYIKENNVITVENLPRHLIVSKDHEHYATSNDIDCKIFVNITVKSIYSKTCITELYFRHHDKFCQFRTLNLELDIMHKINNLQLIISNSVETNYEHRCNKTENSTLLGTYLVTLAEDCSIHSVNHDYIPVKKGEQVNSVKDRLVELVNCCFNLNLDDIKQSNVKINKLASDNIHQLKDLTVEVTEQSNFWENNIKPLPKLMYENKWYSTTFGTIIAIGIIYFVVKCCFRENAKFTLFKKCFCINRKKKLVIRPKVEYLKDNTSGETTIENLPRLRINL